MKVKKVLCENKETALWYMYILRVCYGLSQGE